MAKGHRCSSLPIAEKCAMGPGLSSLGSDRSAAVSSCYHAKCAGDERWREMYTRLSHDERDDVDSMKTPTTIYLGDVVLDYASAHKETSYGITDRGLPVPKGSADAMTEGTPDFWWVRDGVLYVADLKRSEYTSHPGSLQLVAYAFMVIAHIASSANPIRGFVCGIWAATEGTWSWGEYVALPSDAAAELWARVKAAAMNLDDGSGQFSRGKHCRGCYGRERCPAYLVPPEHANDGIAKYMVGELDRTKVLELLEILPRVEATIKACKSQISAHVYRFGTVPDGEGNMYSPVKMPGRVRVDTKQMEVDHPEIVQKYMSTGKGYDQLRWVNDPAFDEQRKAKKAADAKTKKLADKVEDLW